MHGRMLGSWAHVLAFSQVGAARLALWPREPCQTGKKSARQGLKIQGCFYECIIVGYFRSYLQINAYMKKTRSTGALGAV